MAAKDWLEFKGKKPEEQYNRKSSESTSTREGLKNNQTNQEIAILEIIM